MTENEANAAAEGDAEIKRVATHVPGLDAILCGGFLGGVYLIQGFAGSGKTVLASQIIYSHAAQGSRALFVTVLGENHGRMMAHLRPMRFFDQSVVPDRVSYISAYQALDEPEEGLKDLTALLGGEVRACGAAPAFFRRSSTRPRQVYKSSGKTPAPDRIGLRWPLPAPQRFFANTALF